MNYSDWLGTVLGLSFGAVALLIFALIAHARFWKAVDDRINHRVKMLKLADEKAANSRRQIGSADPDRPWEISVGHRSGGKIDAAARRLAESVSTSDGAEPDRDAGDAGPVFGAASPPSLPQAPLRVMRGGSRKDPERDAWGDGAKAPLPVVEAVVAPGAVIEKGQFVEIAKRWVQPVSAPKPIKAPSAPANRGRASKKRRRKVKGAVKKSARPGPTSVVLEASVKKPRKINGAISASEGARA